MLSLFARRSVHETRESQRSEPTAPPTAEVRERIKTTVDLITIGQSRRGSMRKWQRRLGPQVQIILRGALDGLTRAEISKLAPNPGDRILVTELVDGSSVFVAKRHIVSLVQERIEEVERLGAAFTVILCTGSLPGAGRSPALRATRPLVMPDKILRGILRGIGVSGPLGVVTPSASHVPQTEEYWQRYDPVVVSLSLDRENDATSVEGAIAALPTGGVALVLMDCMGFRRATGERIRTALGVPVINPNQLVGRIAAELAGV